MEEFLKEYLVHLKLEKNLSVNTISSYRNDLTAFLSFLKDKNIIDPSEVNPEHISSFFKLLNELGL